MENHQQMQDLLDLMKRQMDAVSTLAAENDRLRAEATPAETGDGATNSTNVGNRYRPKKPERPTVNADIDDREWAIFTDSWSRYKKMCNLRNDDTANIRLELRECCSTDVNKFLFEYVGPTKLDACTEDELLTHIKSVAVKVVHKEVHRMEFNSLVQDQAEPVTQWVARLKSKAFLCEFEIPCNSCTPPRMISYAEEEISQRLVAGLCNQEHQRRILSEASTLTSLELKVKRLQVLETTEKSAQSLQRPASSTGSSEAAAAGRRLSQYKSGKAPPKDPPASEEPEKCRGCGSAPHTGGRKNCPASKKVCFRCKRTGHFGRVCEGSEASSADIDKTDGNDQQLPPSGASVSFSFEAEAPDDDRDFCIARRRKGKR